MEAADGDRVIDAGSRTGPTLFTTAEGLFWRQRINSEYASAMLLERRIARANEINSRPQPYANKPSKTGMPPTTFAAQLARLNTQKARESAAKTYQFQTGSWPQAARRYPNVDDVLSLARAADPPSSPSRPVPWR